MCKQPDESLIGKCEQSITQCFSWCHCYDIKSLYSNIIIKFVFRAFLYLSPSTVHVILNWYWAHFDKRYGEGKSNCCMMQILVVTISHQETELQTENVLSSLYIYLNQCKELLSKPLEANFQIYLEWSWQLMQFYCFFHQWMIVYLFIFKVAGVDYEINSINGYLYWW